ncbi:MAG: tetratricopeptide repeat protein [Roseburia sp.]
MKCANCGAELKVGCVYCSVCGKEAQIVPDYNELDDDYLKALLEEEEMPLQNKQTKSSEEQISVAKKEKKGTGKKKNKKPWILTGIFAVVLVLAAIVVFVVVRTKQSNSFSYQFDKAVAYADQRNYTKAIQYFEKALDLEPDNTDALYELAKIYYTRENYQAAEAPLLQIIMNDSSNKEAYQLLIELYEKQKRYDDIVSLYQSATDEAVKELFSAYILSEPVFDPQGGEYEDTLEIHISAGNGTTIYYTMDGSDPIENGVPYTNSISLEDEGSYTISAVACDERGIFSEVEKEKYVIKFTAPDMATVTPSAGTYTEAVSVTVHVPDGAKAYYTWDGTNPTTASDQYTEPLELPEGNNILSILVVSEQGISSPVARYNYIYQP